MIRLYTHPFSIFPRRVRIVLREKTIPHEELLVDLPNGAHREPEFLRLNPFGQLPVLDDDGLVVCESIAILEYLEERFPEPRLLSADPRERATTRQLMLWSGDYLPGSWKTWVAPAFSPGTPVDAAAREAAYREIAAHLDVLQDRLRARDWLVGQYSLADICYAPIVTVLEYVDLGDLVAARPAVAAWVARMNERPAVRETAPVPVSLPLPPRG
jgi:glutathione S-transferase